MEVKGDSGFPVLLRPSSQQSSVFHVGRVDGCDGGGGGGGAPWTGVMVASVWCCRAWSRGDPAQGRLLCLRPWGVLSSILVPSLPCPLLMPAARSSCSRGTVAGACQTAQGREEVRVHRMWLQVHSAGRPGPGAPAPPPVPSSEFPLPLRLTCGGTWRSTIGWRTTTHGSASSET